MVMGSVIRKPIITERSMQLAKENKFSFVVARSANKEMIKKAISKAFKVDVIGVDVTIQKGKTKRFGNKREERRVSALKKAVVTVKEGQKIDIFDLGV